MSQGPETEALANNVSSAGNPGDGTEDPSAALPAWRSAGGHTMRSGPSAAAAPSDNVIFNSFPRVSPQDLLSFARALSSRLTCLNM